MGEIITTSAASIATDFIQELAMNMYSSLKEMLGKHIDELYTFYREERLIGIPLTRHALMKSGIDSDFRICRILLTDVLNLVKRYKVLISVKEGNGLFQDLPENY